MNAPAARIARPTTRLRGAPARAAFHADHAAPPINSSDPPRLVMRGIAVCPAFAASGPPDAVKGLGSVAAGVTANKAPIETRTNRHDHRRRPGDHRGRRSEPRPSQPTLS